MQGSHVMAMLEGLPNVDNKTHATAAQISLVGLVSRLILMA